MELREGRELRAQAKGSLKGSISVNWDVELLTGGLEKGGWHDRCNTHNVTYFIFSSEFIQKLIMYLKYVRHCLNSSEI